MAEDGSKRDAILASFDVESSDEEEVAKTSRSTRTGKLSETGKSVAVAEAEDATDEVLQFTRTHASMRSTATPLKAAGRVDEEKRRSRSASESKPGAESTRGHAVVQSSTKRADVADDLDVLDVDSPVSCKSQHFTSPLPRPPSNEDDGGLLEPASPADAHVPPPSPFVQGPPALPQSENFVAKSLGREEEAAREEDEDEDAASSASSKEAKLQSKWRPKFPSGMMMRRASKPVSSENDGSEDKPVRASIFKKKAVLAVKLEPQAEEPTEPPAPVAKAKPRVIAVKAKEDAPDLAN